MHFYNKTASPGEEYLPDQGQIKKATIATIIGIPEGLKKSWRRVECLSVAAYFETLTRSIAELKWNVNRIRDNSTSDNELLAAFSCVAADITIRKKTIWPSILRLLMTEYNDTNTTLTNADEGEDWC